MEGIGDSGGLGNATSRRERPLTYFNPDHGHPERVLSKIFTEFSIKRKQDKVAAWMWLQQALAENAGTLCPAVVSLKDLIAAESNIEEMLKGQQGDAGQSPSEYLEQWLSKEEKAQ